MRDLFWNTVRDTLAPEVRSLNIMSEIDRINVKKNLPRLVVAYTRRFSLKKKTSSTQRFVLDC